MVEMFADKVVRYFKSAIKKQKKSYNSSSCFIYLQLQDNEQMPIKVQLDMVISEVILVSNLKSLFNFFDSSEISALEMAMGFNLENEIANTLTEIAEKYKIEPDKLLVCIFEHNSNTYAVIYEDNIEKNRGLLKNELET